MSHTTVIWLAVWDGFSTSEYFSWSFQHWLSFCGWTKSRKFALSIMSFPSHSIPKNTFIISFLRLSLRQSSYQKLSTELCVFNTIITRKATVFTTYKEILLQMCKKWFFQNDMGQLGSISVWMAIVHQFNFTWSIYGPKGITTTQLRLSIFSTLTR